MISISDELKERLHSTVIPQCDVVVSIKSRSGVSDKEVVRFETKDICDLNIASSTDILGRELPSVTATFTQYALLTNGGMLDTTYRDMVEAQMAVDISFVYSIPESATTWNDVKNSYASWNELKSHYATWNEVAVGSDAKEEINLRRLFLTGKPSYADETWTWEAKDIISFLSHDMLDLFGPQSKLWHPSYSATRYALSSIIAGGSHSTIVRNGLNWSQTNVGNTAIKGNVIVEGTASSALKDMYAAENKYISLQASYGGFLDRDAAEALAQTPTETLLLDNMTDFPTKEESTEIKNYVYTKYEIRKDYDNYYEVTVDGKKSTGVYYPNTESKYFFVYNGLSSCYDNNTGGIYLTPSYTGEEITITSTPKSATIYINYGYPSTASAEEARTLRVFPLVNATQDVTMANPYKTYSAMAEDYKEDNHFNTQDSMPERATLLADYFKTGARCITVDTFGMPQIELEDVITVEINEEEESETKKVNCLVVGNDLTYDGALSQTLTLHEIV